MPLAVSLLVFPDVVVGHQHFEGGLDLDRIAVRPHLYVKALSPTDLKVFGETRTRHAAGKSEGRGGVRCEWVSEVNSDGVPGRSSLLFHRRPLRVSGLAESRGKLSGRFPVLGRKQ